MEKKITTQTSKFDELYSIDCSKMIEKKDGLSYLSWANAWAKFKHIHPDASYEVERFDGLPYIVDHSIGIMVYTKVTADGETLGMQLPVMNGNNKTMKCEPYTYQVKDKLGNTRSRTVEAATMFDINKTIMRCLAKNIALFGLGLSIYAGEDIPQPLDDEQPAPAPDAPQPKKKAAAKQTADQEVNLRAETLTAEMFKNGKLNKIVDWLVSKYDEQISDIPAGVIDTVGKSYHWATADVKNDVVAAARRRAFVSDLQGDESNAN